MGDVLTNTPYDDVYKTMYMQCDELVIPLINEVFNEHYTGKEKLIRRGTEHFDTNSDGSQEKRVPDSVLGVCGTETVNYHMECESSKSGEVSIRMYRYGSMSAIDDSEVKDGELHVKFPNAAVIFLRRRSSTPDVIKIHVEMPTGESVIYPIRTLKVSDYDLDEIFEKRLYFLIPFYLFNYESRLKEYDEDPEKLQELKDLYVDIHERLTRDTDNGGITATTYGVVKVLSRKVAQNLTSNYEEVRKGLGDVMGGKVLDLEVFRIRDEEREKAQKEYEAKVKEAEAQAKEAEAQAKEAEAQVKAFEARADAAEARVKELEAKLAALS